MDADTSISRDILLMLHFLFIPRYISYLCSEVNCLYICNTKLINLGETSVSFFCFVLLLDVLGGFAPPPLGLPPQCFSLFYHENRCTSIWTLQQIFVLLQKKIKRKGIALLVGCSQSTLSREIRRNSTDKGNYLWDKAHAKAMDCRKRTTANHAKDPAIVWEALDLLKEEYWSPEQISADMKSRGKNISHELIYRHIRADQSGELASYCRHKMKYTVMYNPTGLPK